MKIYAFHLLNDYSGSPKVLSQLLRGWSASGLDCVLVTNKESQGFLSDLPSISTLYFPYRFSENKIMRLFRLIYSQLAILVMLWNRVRKEDIFYINTVLPFGAAILAHMRGCKIIYHIHETTVRPPLLKNFLFTLVGKTADVIVFVSAFLKKESGFDDDRTIVILNSIENKFLSTAHLYKQEKESIQNILMICSLKKYKGVDEFVTLAERHSDLLFRLIVNSGTEEINQYWSDKTLPRNLEILPTQKNVHPHYQWSDIVVNLSRPDGWIETFGLTAVEAMAYRRPTIVPPVGGIAEIVRDGVEGFQVDSRDSEKLSRKISQLTSDRALYQSMAAKAADRIKDFQEEQMIRQSLKSIQSITSQKMETFHILDNIS